MRLLLLLAAALVGSGAPVAPDTLALPKVGDHALHILSPQVLELSLISAGSTRWNFAASRPSNLEVKVNGESAKILETGFRRRAAYAPIRRHDVRVGNHIYIKIAGPIAEGSRVEALDPKNELGGTEQWSSKAAPDRISSSIHINQLGYATGAHKLAEVGETLGTLGELEIPLESGFSLIAKDGKVVFHGELNRRPDRGFRAAVYQNVYEADFTSFDGAGTYQLEVKGLGRSLPFLIDPGAPAALARTYALGTYQQRCGVALELPYTRFVHAACHTARATIPDDSAKNLIARLRDNKPNSSQSAPVLNKPSDSIYPFVQTGSVDVSGGHHDAGDYGKYTISSTDMINALVFAADVFPGVAALDNLGLPESGDGQGDILQIARREADFLVKMQDSDGGFYSLVQPLNRTYETNVSPDHGDPQVVFPKNTTVTAAAVAALAQAGSSPKLRAQSAADAERYLSAAKKGWQFLERARAKFGKGAFQRVHHYGDDNQDEDELAWAAVEMFLATGDKDLKARAEAFDPHTRKWGWMRLPYAYGKAVRSYAFGALSGRRRADELDAKFLDTCQQELLLAAHDLTLWSQASSYGTPVSIAARHAMRIGWYLSGAQTFDLTAAWQLTPTDEIREAISSAFDYELGVNPINISYLTGVGWKRQHEIVSQVAENQRQQLPPSGIELGGVQEGVAWLGQYKRELFDLTFPSDANGPDAYPLYDRWTDAFNLFTEGSTATEAQSLASAAFWMARSPLASQPWRAATAHIEGLGAHIKVATPNQLTLSADGLDLKHAQIVWDAAEGDPVFGSRATYTPEHRGHTWIEAEAMLPDGRRVFAVAEAVVE